MQHFCWIDSLILSLSEFWQLYQFIIVLYKGTILQYIVIFVSALRITVVHKYLLCAAIHANYLVVYNSKVLYIRTSYFYYKIVKTTFSECCCVVVEQYAVHVILLCLHIHKSFHTDTSNAYIRYTQLL